MEVVLNHHPGSGDTLWQGDLRVAAPGSVVEGRVGPLVALLASPRVAPAVAELPSVSAVRLPRPASAQLLGPGAARERRLEALRSHVLSRADAAQYLGRGGRVAVLGSDFRGYERFLGKGLPAGTKLIDLTALRNTSLHGDPYASDAKEIGQGTQAALDLAAPGTELTLIRIDPASPTQLHTVARLINGEDFARNRGPSGRGKC